MDNEKSTDARPPRSEQEVALELMKFIAVETSCAKGAPTAGFSGKAARSPEEQIEILLGLFERCRRAVAKPIGPA